MINIFNNRSKKELKLLKEIKALLIAGSDARVKELEAQMDSWLATLKQSISKIKTVSEQVDSK